MIEQYIAMYAPTVLMAISTLLNYVKLLSGLKNNASAIMQHPNMIALQNELENTKQELTLMRSQMKEMIERQGQLINELSKVEQYEVGKNEEV